MRNYRRYFLIFLLLITINLGFSIGVYDSSGNYVYFVNNPRPTINVTISCPEEPIFIQKAMLNDKLNAVTASVNENSHLNPIDGNKTYSFKYNDFKQLNGKEIGNISISNKKFFFKLFAYGVDGKSIKPEGDPVYFRIDFDNVKPELINLIGNGSSIYLSYNDLGIPLYFSKLISHFNVYSNGRLVESYSNESQFMRDYKKNFNLIFNKSDFREGLNNMTIKFWDLAGNENSFSTNIRYRAANLKIFLLTLRNDSSLKYNFNEKYPDLFGNTIYTSENNFVLKVKTSKPAICYFSSNLLNFAKFDTIPTDSLSKMQSSDNEEIHSVNINAENENKIWIYCSNPVYSDDFAYLSESLGIGDKLINVEKYQSPNVKITSIIPNGEVTSLPFNFLVTTNSKSICNYRRHGSVYTQMNSSNYLLHKIFYNQTSLGNFTFDFSCVDVLNNVDTKSISLKIDTNVGVQVLSYSPKYTDTSSVDLKLELSEDSQCRYSLQNVNLQDFENLTLINQTGLSREVSVSPLKTGNNSIYLYCKKGVAIYKRVLSVIYDPNPPRISNFTFINNGIYNPTFVGSTSKLRFKFDVHSLIPVEKYFITINKPNSTINRTSITNNVNLNLDLKNATSLNIVAQNLIGKNSSVFEKDIKFDLTPPELSFTNVMGKIKIVCYDVGGSGCNRTLYSLSKTSICQPMNSYSYNSTIDVGDNNYICAKAYDNVGLSSNKLEPILFSNLGNETENNTQNNFITNETSGNITNTTNTSTEGNNNFENSTENNNLSEPWPPGKEFPAKKTNYLLIAAMFLLIAVTSGSGYYAYKKGYLNNELKKLGIKVPEQKKTGSTSMGLTGVKHKFGKNSVKSSIMGKSKYEHHLNKLNNFIDGEVKKGEPIFGKFEGSEKRSDKDLNLDGKVGHKKVYSDLSKDDFDEIYRSSKKINDLAMSSDLKKEAENFEEYYKNKKKKKGISDDKKNKGE